MSTADPQLINWFSTGLPWLAAIVCGALAVYVARKARALATLKLDVSELFERLEALQDRFTRFQRREGMRETRKEKTDRQDLLREAQAIVAQGATVAGGSGQPAGPGTHPKIDLYRGH